MGVKTLHVTVALTPTLAAPSPLRLLSPIEGEGIGFSDTVRLRLLFSMTPVTLAAIFSKNNLLSRQIHRVAR